MAAYTGQPGVDWGAVAQGVAMETGLRDFEQKQKAEAIRWQGQQDYQTLVDSGVDSMEALRRSAPKLFFNDPRGLASAIGDLRKGIGPEGDPVTKRLPDGSLAVWTGNSWHVASRERPQPGDYVTITQSLPDGSTVKRQIPTGELGKFQSDQEAAAQAQALEAQKALGTGGLMGGIKSGINRFAGREPDAPLPWSGMLDAALGPGGAAVRRLIGGGAPTAPSPAAPAPSGPAAPTPPMPPAPAAPPGAAPSYPPAPPSGQRKAGEIYMLPKGPAVWRGNGWEPLESSITSENFDPRSVGSYTGPASWMNLAPGADIAGNAGIRG